MPQFRIRRTSDQTALSITTIEIDLLFGEFNYYIAVPAQTDGQQPLVILYGDNGSGKTTLLNLLVHLLSPEPYEGHRTWIGETQFQRLMVKLSDGTRIVAKRTGEKLGGDYSLTIEDQTGTIVEYQWSPERRRRMAESMDDDDESYALYCRTLEGLNVTIHFLSDSRKVSSFQRSRRRRHPREAEHMLRAMHASGELIFQDGEDESWLKTAIENAVQTVRSLTLAGTNRGFESANQIYKDIVSRLIVPSAPSDDDPPELRAALQERLEILGERNVAYTEFGLTPPLEMDNLEALLGKAPDDKLHLLQTVLAPHLDGVQARLDALEDAQKVVSAFSRLMSDFYHGKTVRLHLSEGVSINTRRGQSLRPEDLSSGEQQLMLLMCNAITARRDSVVFAIDEPELSLNVKWQRKLVDALLEIIGGSRCQLLLATHSIELLSKYSANVVHLKEDGDDA